jgi:FkbH-like protein
MDTADYLSLANSYKDTDRQHYSRSIKINLVTNFTDQVLERFLTGLCLENGIYPEILTVPYKQYDFYLADRNSGLYIRKADITYIFFDANIYNRSPFTIEGGQHFNEIFSHLENFIAAQKNVVVINNFILPYHSQYGNLFLQNKLFNQIVAYNDKLRILSLSLSNLYLFDTNRLLSRFGEKHARDLRGLYAFDMPFSNDFLLLVAREWFSYIQVQLGTMTKCIVVDLDNTLWGGVVGELGAENISLGPQYPGIAFQNFQRALLECYNRGILLAVNSKNNEADVDEVFQKNRHMILSRDNFATVRINWDLKSNNLLSIAEELNIGVDSLVFIDDDPVNREIVRENLPNVLVPDFSLPPELYVDTLFSLPIFNQFKLTDEDKEKGLMYEQEKQRKEVRSNSVNIADYISRLDLKLIVTCNDMSLIPRLSQLSFKTNQFNLTTKRYSETAIADLMSRGFVYAGDVCDKFGSYGITVMAILVRMQDVADLDVFLMSCRVMGRGVETEFISYVIEDMKKKGVTKMTASFIPTTKNVPAKDFLANAGFFETDSNEDGSIYYAADLGCTANLKVAGSIHVEIQ